MAAIDLLEELKLNDYYPQKLSFSDAIRLLEETHTARQKQYGLEIVRRLLAFDPTAVVSVISDINEHLNNTGKKKEPETKRGVGTSKRVSNSMKTGGKTQKSRRKLHPMDLLVVVMSCCDDFLRQIIVERMFTNKLSIPVLLPDVKNGTYTFLLFTIRSLVPEVQVSSREDLATLNDTLIYVKNPIVSFIRIGKLHRSKSKLVNELLNFNSFNTFFHRDCPNGSAKRSVSSGSIEAAWFQSSTATENEFNCRLFTVLNLRGDARDYPKQTQFLCQSSTLVVFMVDSLKSFIELYQNVLNNIIDVSKTETIVCHISPASGEDKDEESIDFVEDLCATYLISDEIDDEEKVNDVDFTNDLRNTIRDLFSPKSEHLAQLPTYANIIQRGKTFGFSHDDDEPKYKIEKLSADKFVDSVLTQPQDCKSIILPLQGEPWEKIGKLEREQREKLRNENQDEYFIAEKEKEKRCQREIQCLSLVQQNEIARTFFERFHLSKEQGLLYYLNYCKIRLDARSRVIASDLLQTYNKEKLKAETSLRHIESKMESSTIGLEHILRECGQIYEAVISEENRLRELMYARLTPDFIRDFPLVMAKLLLNGEPLELMDGDASNIPTTWLKAVLSQIEIITNNAKVFVLSIIGVQSSGKSTLLNALFGLHFQTSSGRCTRGIYCHLVPVDKESHSVDYDYVLVVDTEGLGSSSFSGKSPARDNELATFAIGLADATIINMKGENWSELKDILQIAAYGLIRVRKTKSGLELMPRCMFVHQNVPAADAEEKNRFGQDRQLSVLDEAIKAAASNEGFKDITRFDQVIKYDAGSHSRYFPDLWCGRPPKARISPEYTKKANDLKKHIMQVMKASFSKLTISGFSHRMFDLWNAMLHNDFVLSFSNTNDIISGTKLNDRISNKVDDFKNKNKIAQTQIRDSIYSIATIEELNAQKESKVREASDAVETNFAILSDIAKDLFDVSDICEDLKQKYDISLNQIKTSELRRINQETTNVIRIHIHKFEYLEDPKVKDLKDRLDALEKCIAQEENDKIDEKQIKINEEKWQKLFDENKALVDARIKTAERIIGETIRKTIENLNPAEKIQLNWPQLLRSPFVDEMPEVTENDICIESKVSKEWVKGFFSSKSNFHEAINEKIHAARKEWESEFQNQRYVEFKDDSFKEVFTHVGQLLGIIKKAHDVRSETDENWMVLPPGYIFNKDYISKFIRFACHFAYNRSLENSKRYISLTDPLANVYNLHQNYLNSYQKMTAEGVSELIFDYAKRHFIGNLGELIKTEVCKANSKYPTLKTKRAFLRTILADLGQQTHALRDKEILFKQFMLYVNLGESDASENFFFAAILKVLKEMLIKESASESDYQNMVKNNIGVFVNQAKNSLREADRTCDGHAGRYIIIFRENMTEKTDIYFRKDDSSELTEAAIKQIDKLYDELVKSEDSEDFFDAILKLLNEMLPKESASESDFQIALPTSIATFVEEARFALEEAKKMGDGRAERYLKIFKENMKERTQIYFRKYDSSAFTETVIKQIDILYADFLSQANSSFETLACKNGKAAIRPLFEKIMGCRERCPLCSAPCSQSLDGHPEDHRAIHYPMGVRGTVHRKRLPFFRDTEETFDAVSDGYGQNAIWKYPLTVNTCHILIGTNVDIRTKATVKEYDRWYQKLLNLNSHRFKQYKKLDEYRKWDIPHNQDQTVSLYWKWFMAQYVNQLAEKYNANCPEIPNYWQDTTWEEAERNLYQSDYFTV